MPSIVISNITEKVHVKMRSFQNEKAVITEVFGFVFLRQRIHTVIMIT